MDLLEQTGHRPWSLPARPWIMRQTWHNLLFAHWPVPASALRRIVPPQLKIDTFGGYAWLGIVAFRLSDIRLRGMPSVPGVTGFPEINVRTYVTYGGKPGVLFLSLDTDHRLVVSLARSWFRLAYHPAQVRLRSVGDVLRFTSRRAPGTARPAAFSATYRPYSSPYFAASGSLEHWLTERYCYYSVTPAGQVYRCDIHHAPWALQWAEADIDLNTMAGAHGIRLPAGEPFLHYAHQMQALIWPLGRVAEPQTRVAAPAYTFHHWEGV
jgi:uncharacterized protein YqjF (DUF2071 family)